MSKFAYALYLIFLILLNAGVLITPFLAREGSSYASFLYNAYKPLCHQWIYRTYCLFDGFDVEACINGSVARVETRFTDAPKDYDGIFVYSREQIGKNRAEVVYRDGKVGYKFPVCARDIGFYLGLLIGALAYPFIFKEEDTFPLSFLLIAILPLAVDGFYQLFTTYESPLSFRLTTGLASGFLSSIILVGNIISKMKD